MRWLSKSVSWGSGKECTTGWRWNLMVIIQNCRNTNQVETLTMFLQFFCFFLVLSARRRTKVGNMFEQTHVISNHVYDSAKVRPFSVFFDFLKRVVTRTDENDETIIFRTIRPCNTVKEYTRRRNVSENVTVWSFFCTEMASDGYSWNSFNIKLS